MSDLDDSFAKLLGRQPTDADRQQLYRVRDALGLKNNDALWLVLMALQHYESLYGKIPEKISRSATIAAQSSAEQAKAQVTEAVAALVPSVEHAVERAAADAVSRIRLGSSLISIWAATVILGLVFGLGVLLGSGFFHTLTSKTLAMSWSQFLAQTSWGIGIGSAIPGLLMLGLLSGRDGDDMRWWQWGTVLLALAGFLLLALKWWTGFSCR